MMRRIKGGLLSTLVVGAFLGSTLTCDIPNVIVIDTGYDDCGYWCGDSGWGWGDIWDIFIDIEIDD